MKQHYIDERTGISYTLQGDYYLPNFMLPVEENKFIGIWGQRHAKYLKQNHKVLYMNLLTSGNLNRYLSDIDKQAEDMFFWVVKQLAEKEGITEKLKAKNQMEWVQRINNICGSVIEIVNSDLIYT